MTQEGKNRANQQAASPRPTAAGDSHFVADQNEVIAFLSRPQTYGATDQPVRIETHIAVVFLAGEFAYKMNRAVRYPFVDFSTLEQRRKGCEAEVAVNQPNAPQIYIDTLPVVRRHGGLHLGGDGEVVEWLVRTATSCGFAAQSMIVNV